MGEKTPPQTREQRLAARLRENLKRRKVQARALGQRDEVAAASAAETGQEPSGEAVPQPTGASAPPAADQASPAPQPESNPPATSASAACLPHPPDRTADRAGDPPPAASPLRGDASPHAPDQGKRAPAAEAGAEDALPNPPTGR